MGTCGGLGHTRRDGRFGLSDTTVQRHWPPRKPVRANSLGPGRPSRVRRRYKAAAATAAAVPNAAHTRAHWPIAV